MNVALLLMLIGCFQIPVSQGQSAAGHDHTSEITGLLRGLYPTQTQDGPEVRSPELIQNVESRLKLLAEQSPAGRTEVIEALIQVVRDPDARKEWPVARRWTLAVDLLGYLRATEAIEVLINNLDHTGENGIMSSIHYQPVARALDNIGLPAVPGLIEALDSNQEEVRYQATQTLARIGKPALPSLLSALAGRQHSTKSRVAFVLASIGGQEAKQAIEQAIETEENVEVRIELREALIEFAKRWGLRH